MFSISDVGDRSIRTEFMEFTPVPVATVVVKCIMSMAHRHSFRTSCRLISLSPTAFNLLTISLTGEFNVIECPKKLTGFDVILDMHFGYCSSHLVD